MKECRKCYESITACLQKWYGFLRQRQFFGDTGGAGGGSGWGGVQVRDCLGEYPRREGFSFSPLGTSYPKRIGVVDGRGVCFESG